MCILCYVSVTVQKDTFRGLFRLLNRWNQTSITWLGRRWRIEEKHTEDRDDRNQKRFLWVKLILCALSPSCLNTFKKWANFFLKKFNSKEFYKRYIKDKNHIISSKKTLRNQEKWICWGTTLCRPLHQSGPLFISFIISKVHFHSEIPKNYLIRIICEVTVNILYLHSS